MVSIISFVNIYVLVISHHNLCHSITLSTEIVLISEYDYLTTVDRISLNENYAAACGPDGKLTLHWVSINLKKIIILTRLFNMFICSRTL